MSREKPLTFRNKIYRIPGMFQFMFKQWWQTAYPDFDWYFPYHRMDFISNYLTEDLRIKYYIQEFFNGRNSKCH